MKLCYPVLHSAQLAEQLQVDEFTRRCWSFGRPDPGTVQGIFVGYNLTLREDLIRVRSLRLPGGIAASSDYPSRCRPERANAASAGTSVVGYVLLVATH